MSVRRLKEFLDSHNIKYVTIIHSPAYTAQEIAASAHITGKEVVKTVIVKLNGKIAMVVLPAHISIDFDRLRGASGAESVELADEEEFKGIFPESEVGAMPPFGNLYDLEVYVAESLAGNRHITFNAGTFSEMIRMEYRDYERLVKPKAIVKI